MSARILQRVNITIAGQTYADKPISPKVAMAKLAWLEICRSHQIPLVSELVMNESLSPEQVESMRSKIEAYIYHLDLFKRSLSPDEPTPAGAA